jgi:hypothetical protein
MCIFVECLLVTAYVCFTWFEEILEYDIYTYVRLYTYVLIFPIMYSNLCVHLRDLSLMLLCS